MSHSGFMEGAMRRSEGLWIESNLAFLAGKRKNLSEGCFLLKQTYLDPKDCNAKKTHQRQLDCTDKMIGNNQSWRSNSGKKAKSNARGETFERKKEMEPGVSQVKILWKAEENSPCLAIHSLREKDTMFSHKGDRHPPWTGSGRNFWVPVTEFYSMPSFLPWGRN